MSSSINSQALRYDMPSVRAAPEIDPVERIASSNAILPGPMRSPLGKSMRMERCRPAMMHPSARSRSQSDDRSFVKEHV